MASESSRPKPPPGVPPQAAVGPPPIPVAARRVPTPAPEAFIDADDLAFAWAQVRKHLHQTPVVPAPMLRDYLDGGEFVAKLETRQLMGSFKTRGAVARLACDDVRGASVVAASAGNHGLGIGFASRLLDVAATVVVPQTVPRVKRLRIEELVQLIVAPYDGYDETERYARALAHSRGAIFVSPFDDPVVAAANGATLAREVLAAAPECDALVVPVGGGGLCAGIGRYLEASKRTDVAVIGVQSETNAAMAQSFALGRAVVHLPATPTLAEGLEGGVAPRTYAVARRTLRELVTVSEHSIGRAMALVFQEMGEALEGSAAVTVAAVLEGRIPRHLRRPCLVFTGRNVDRDVLEAQLTLHLGPRRRL